MPFTSLALKNLKFEEKTLHFTERTLARNLEKQSGARSPSPPVAGDLEAQDVKVREEVARGALQSDEELPATAMSTPPGTNHLGV
jgi:hypothetical protein